MPTPSMVKTTHPKSPLDLPYEIRQIIFTHLLVSDLALYVCKKGTYKYEEECAGRPHLVVS
jgi:hypothetical protein